MKMGIVSDFHMEAHKGMAPKALLDRYADFLPPELSFDILVAAGDMGHSLTVGKALEELQDRLQTPVIFVPGNHEFYDCSPAYTFDQALDHMRGAGVEVLFNSHRDFPDQRVSVWGSPWFTDFSRTEEDYSKVGIADYFRTYVMDEVEPRRITPDDHVLMNRVAQKSLETWLIHCSQKGYRPVVVTHWGPSGKSAHGMFPPDDVISAYFTTDYLDRNHDKFPPGSVWIHGHTHYNVDYQIGNVRVCSNQLGYAGAYPLHRRDRAEGTPEGSCLSTYNPLKYLEV